jgi:hypothetical protein
MVLMSYPESVNWRYYLVAIFAGNEESAIGIANEQAICQPSRFLLGQMQLTGTEKKAIMVE